MEFTFDVDRSRTLVTMTITGVIDESQRPLVLRCLKSICDLNRGYSLLVDLSATTLPESEMTMERVLNFVTILTDLKAAQIPQIAALIPKDDKREKHAMQIERMAVSLDINHRVFTDSQKADKWLNSQAR